MAGTFLSFAFDDAAADASLARAERALANPAELQAPLGEYLTGSTKDRFKAGGQRAPDGTPWQALQPRYKETKTKNKDHILVRDGRLSASIRWQPDGVDAVLVGTNSVYGAVHQLGAVIRPKTKRALAFNGRMVSSVTIPARPYLGLSGTDKTELREITIDWLRGTL